MKEVYRPGRAAKGAIKNSKVKSQKEKEEIPASSFTFDFFLFTFSPVWNLVILRWSFPHSMIPFSSISFLFYHPFFHQLLVQSFEEA